MNRKAHMLLEVCFVESDDDVDDSVEEEEDEATDTMSSKTV